MAITKLLTDLNNVQGLENLPNDVTGLTPAQLKAIFDKAPNDIQTYINGLVDILNSVTPGSSGAENIASAPIPGIAGDNVYEQIANMLVVAQAAQAGTILPGVVTDSMLSDTAGQIKNTVVTHLADMLYHVPYGGVTTNSGNAYSISTPTITALTEGKAICIKCNADSTGAVTFNWCNLGAKSVLKANQSAVTNWKNGGIYTLRYDGTNFMLQGEGASGNAIASHLLSGDTATVDAGEIAGTMTNNGTVTLTSGTSNQALIGYYASGSKIQGVQATVSSTIIATANTLWNKKILTPTKAHEITVNFGGTIRLTCSIYTQNASYSAYAQFYKNDVAVGSVYNTTNTSGFAISYDIDVVYGDKVSIYGWGASLSYYAWCSAFSICGVPNIALTGTVIS